MDDSGPFGSIILYLAFLLIDVFYFGFGTALEALNENNVRHRAQEGDKKSVRLSKMLDNPSYFANTLHMLTILINMVMGSLYLGLVSGTVSNWLLSLTEKLSLPEWISGEAVAAVAAVLSAVFLLYITLTIGVLLPRKLAARHPDGWAYACVTPVYYSIRIISPFTAFASATCRGILRLFGVRDAKDESDVTEEEIISMINEGHEQGVIQASEAEMISNIFAFGDKEAQDIMTHRNNVVAIDGNMQLRDAIQFILDGTNSRYPVYEENLDNIIGILHLKDAMRYYGEEESLSQPLKELQGVMREPVFVPRTKNIDELFREMQAGKQQMVIVVDEYGQTDGLVAMEDILEEIVGNIMDEYDEDSGPSIEKKGEDEYEADGMTRLEELGEHLGISFDDVEFETLNGFLISRLDRIPEPDEEFNVDYQGYNFKILRVENKIIRRVLVTKLPEEPDETDGDDRDETQTVLEEETKK